jgi:hypothetical protein
MAKDAVRILLHKTNVGVAVVAGRCPTKKDLCRAAGVRPGTYAAELVERFHEFFIGRAVDVRGEYEQYYAAEYGCLEEFLYQKYGMAEQCVQALRDAIRSDRFLGLAKESWGRDWQMQSLSEYFPVGLAALMAAMHAAWAEDGHEDQV